MNNLSCKIVRDLLPIYRDGLASKKTIEYVEEHLKSCDECKDEYNKIINKPKQNYGNANDVYIRMKRRIITLFIGLVSFGLALTCISVFCIPNKSSFPAIYDWILWICFSIGVYFIPCLALFASIVFFKTKSGKIYDYFGKVITTFLVIGILTLAGFNLWKFIDIILYI